MRGPPERTHPSSGCYGMQRGHTIHSSLKVIAAELLGQSERARATKVLSPFMEARMIRVPTDPLGLRKKLDVHWMTRIWVGRVDESVGLEVLTPHETVTGRTVRSSPIWWESPRVVFEIQRCLRPNF